MKGKCKEDRSGQREGRLTRLRQKMDWGRVGCPNFGHPALTSSFTRYKFLQVKYSVATILNRLSVLKLIQLSNDDLLFP